MSGCKPFLAVRKNPSRILQYLTKLSIIIDLHSLTSPTKGGYGNYSKRGRYDDGQSSGSQSQESNNPQAMLAQMKQMMNQVSCWFKVQKFYTYAYSTDAANAKPNDADGLRPTSDVPADATDAGFDFPKFYP